VQTFRTFSFDDVPDARKTASRAGETTTGGRLIERCRLATLPAFAASRDSLTPLTSLFRLRSPSQTGTAHTGLPQHALKAGSDLVFAYPKDDARASSSRNADDVVRLSSGSCLAVGSGYGLVRADSFPTLPPHAAVATAARGVEKGARNRAVGHHRLRAAQRNRWADSARRNTGIDAWGWWLLPLGGRTNWVNKPPALQHYTHARHWQRPLLRTHLFCHHHLELHGSLLVVSLIRHRLSQPHLTILSLFLSSWLYHRCALGCSITGQTGEKGATMKERQANAAWRRAYRDICAVALQHRAAIPSTARRHKAGETARRGRAACCRNSAAFSPTITTYSLCYTTCLVMVCLSLYTLAQGIAVPGGRNNAPPPACFIAGGALTSPLPYPPAIVPAYIMAVQDAPCRDAAPLHMYKRHVD